MWKVTYADGSIDVFEDMTIELVCEYIDNKKQVIKIESLNGSIEGMTPSHMPEKTIREQIAYRAGENIL